MIAPSFGDIFRQNSLKIGLLPVALPAAAVKELMAAAGDGELTVDLEAQTVTAGGRDAPRSRWTRSSAACLLEGLDEIALTLLRGRRDRGLRGGASGADLDAVTARLPWVNSR